MLGDKRIEADEVFYVDLASSLIGSPAIGRVTGWILDDDDPTAPPPEDPVDPNQCSPDHPYYPNCECTPDHPYYPNCGN